MQRIIPSLAVLGAAVMALSGCAHPLGATATASPAVAADATALPAAPAAATVASGNSKRTLAVGGIDRSYLLHIPAWFTADEPQPLVMVFHFYSGTGEDMEKLTGFSELADIYGFLVAYPEGTGPAGETTWNAGGCCGYAADHNIDEAAFVRAILSDLQMEARIDPKRIYATGLSNGAFLSYRLGCGMSDTFAAVAPVAGVLLNNPCNPSQPVSVLHIHGMADPLVPYAGSTTPAASGVFESAEQSVATWARRDGCPSAPDVEKSGPVTHTIFAACKNGTAVELYSLQGIGRIWPPAAILPASRIIWNFFAAHPKT
jgi:polyhydroxybutyrate depolymerase